MKKYLLGALALCIAAFSFAQKRSYNWTMGDSLGLNFNTTPPTPFNAKMFSLEGCASVSDTSGSLLFYTNGINVYNRNHEIMSNGSNIGGDDHSSQMIIVPVPNSGNEYYIFTPGLQGATLRYSIVNMALDGGLGGVSSKGNGLLANATERITSVMHSNNVDVWVIAQSFVNFHAYKITSNGLNPAAVKSALFTPILSTMLDNTQTIGNMKFSHDGNKLAVTLQENDLVLNDTGRVELYDFDRTTGMISNGIGFNERSPYGVEFSPSNEILYVSVAKLDLSSSSQLLQYDLSDMNTDSILASRSVLNEDNTSKGALELAPNGQIVVAMAGSNFISHIAKPDLLGDDCDYNFPGTVVITNNSFNLGLPQRIASPILEYYEICDGDSISIGSKTVKEEGIYSDTTYNSSNEATNIRHYQLTVNALPEIDQPSTMMICDSIELPEITGSNLSDNVAYFTGSEGYGTKYQPGDYYYKHGTVFLFDSTEKGCSMETTLTLTECKGDFPNIITANEDGVNDTFKLRLPEADKHNIYVYNRWGKLVYEQESYTNDWNAEGLASGTYYYRVVHQTKQEEYTGELYIAK